MKYFLLCKNTVITCLRFPGINDSYNQMIDKNHATYWPYFQLYLTVRRPRNCHPLAIISTLSYNDPTTLTPSGRIFNYTLGQWEDPETPSIGHNFNYILQWDIKTLPSDGYIFNYILQWETDNSHKLCPLWTMFQLYITVRRTQNAALYKPYLLLYIL